MGRMTQTLSLCLKIKTLRNYTGRSISLLWFALSVLHLGPEMDIRKTWVGFPTTVTSAVSVPTTLGDGYKYYVFSPSKYTTPSASEVSLTTDFALTSGVLQSTQAMKILKKLDSIYRTRALFATRYKRFLKQLWLFQTVSEIKFSWGSQHGWVGQKSWQLPQTPQTRLQLRVLRSWNVIISSGHAVKNMTRSGFSWSKRLALNEHGF